nr:hypothetical protein [uncultured Marinifilum sp.]
MIQEIINYTKHLKENSPLVFQRNLEPSKGLHIFIELDDDGNLINFPGEKGKQWDYYDGKTKTEFLNNIARYDLASTYITMNKQKKFDAKQKIHSASPYALSFNFNFSNDDKELYGILTKPTKEQKKRNNRKIKKKRVEIVVSRIDEYFENTKSVFQLSEEEIQWADTFKLILTTKLKGKIQENIKSILPIKAVWDSLSEKEYCKLYLKNISLETYENIYEPYLSKNIYNKDVYNVNNENKTYGVIDFYTTFADKKQFLKHKTAFYKDGISQRYSGKDAQLLKDFEQLKKSKVFPNPLPLFIDKKEFTNTDLIIKIFKEEGVVSYPEILKQFYRNNEEKVLENYYLLFFSGLNIEDFDFVSRFRYYLEKDGQKPKIKNLFVLTKDKEILQDYSINNIFHFEADIVGRIFNNSLVKIKDNSYSTSYFGEVKPEFVSGGEPVYQMIMKYRKAFYDYIYKSKEQAISCLMWDEIMWNSIIADLRNDSNDSKGYSTREYGIKQKLNIWFSLYNYFTNNIKRTDMASKIPELLEKMKSVANNENEVLATTEEFAFACGQVIYYLLNQSRASERTHALLEPFLQKVKIVQLQNSIAQAINTYKHEISFGKGRFEKLSAQVLAFESDENLKDYLRLILAGYFAPAAIYEKKEKLINE